MPIKARENIETMERNTNNGSERNKEGKVMDCNVSFINLVCFGDAIKLLILQLPEWLCCNEWAQPKVFIPCYRCSAARGPCTMQLKVLLPVKQKVLL